MDDAEDPETPDADPDWSAKHLLVYLPASAALGLMLISVVLFSGVLGLPAGYAQVLLFLFTSLGLVLLTVTLAYVAYRRPVFDDGEIAGDPEAAKARRELGMEAIQAVLVVLTGVAVIVEAAAIFQGLLGGKVPEPAVVVFRRTYMFVLAGFTATLMAAAIARTTQDGGREAGWGLPVAAGLAVASAGVAAAMQYRLVPFVEPAHAIFATNVGFAVLGAYTLWFCSFPSAFRGFVQQLRDLPEMQRSIRKRAILVGLIAGSLGLVGFIASLAFADNVGVVHLGDRVTMLSAAAGTIVAGLLLFVLGFRAAGRLSDDDHRPEDLREEEIGTERRMSPEEIRFWATIVGSATVATALALLGVLAHTGTGPVPAGIASDLFVFAIMAAVGPYGLYAYIRRRRIEDIEDKFPELLRDLTEAQRAGMTLPEAVRSTSKSNYGVLSEELDKMAAEMSWGVSFHKSLRKFADRIDTPLINRSVALIIQASQAGGDVEEILEAAARDAREIRTIQQERKMGMSIYVMIVYIAFFVFLAVVAIMASTFIPAMAEAGKGVAGSDVGGSKISSIDPSVFNTLFFHGAVVQALGGGLVAGIMGDGYPEAGLKHGFVLLIVAYLAFRLLIGL